MKLQPDHFYRVRWHDAAETNDPEKVSLGQVTETCGWVVRSNRYGVRLASERNAPDHPNDEIAQYRGLTDIPRKMILDAKEWKNA